MKSRFTSFALLLGLLFLIVAFTSSCNTKKPQFVVGDNFSMWMPETPARTASANDEGMPETNWEVKHTGITTAELYSVTQSCYRELLNPDDELESNEMLLALNGVKSIDRRRFEIVAKETGRNVPAMFSATQETSTGIVLHHVAVVDGHCLITAAARLNTDNVGAVAQFASSMTIFK